MLPTECQTSIHHELDNPADKYLPKTVAHLQEIHGNPLIHEGVVGVHALPHAALIHMLKFGYIPGKTEPKSIDPGPLGSLFFYPTNEGRSLLGTFYDTWVPTELIHEPDPVKGASSYGFSSAGFHYLADELGIDPIWLRCLQEGIENTILDYDNGGCNADNEFAINYYASLLELKNTEFIQLIQQAQLSTFYVVGISASVLTAYPFDFGTDTIGGKYASDLYVMPGEKGLHFSHIASISHGMKPSWADNKPYLNYPFEESIERASLFLDSLLEIDVETI